MDSGKIKSATEKNLTVIFVVALTLLIFGAVYSYRATEAVIRNNRWVSHSLTVLNELESAISFMKDAETGQRGFLITANEDYLQPYNAVVSRIHQQIASLKTLTADNSTQQRLVLVLDDKIRAKLTELNETIAIRQKEGFAAAQQAVLSNRGKRDMDGIRQTIAAMQGEERRLLIQRTNDSEAAAQWAILALSIAGLITGASLFILYRRCGRGLAELRQKEQSVREQREWLEGTLASIGDGVIATDSQGRVKFMNAVSEDLTGWKQDEAEGKQLDKIFNIVNEKTRLSIENPVDRVLREGKITALENHTLLIQKNGAEIPIDDCAAPIRSSDVLNGAVLVFRDITERYRAERERVVLFEREQTARAQAEAANTAKDEFLAIVSHELRTPLSAILGWARLLSIGKLDGQATHDAIDAIEQSAKAQAGLIEDLLDVSRIMSGKLRIKLEPVKLESVIEAALDTVRPAAEAKSIHLEAKLDAAAGAVLGDATRLQQVIWNLLSNAVKFTPKDGHVYVRLERAGSHAQLTVTDTGQGIKGDFLPHVFERFKQADSTDTRQHGGLGLGLAIVRSLVEMHGGTVTADSRGDGLGATFTLRFPVSAVEASIEMPVEKLAPMPSLSGLHVLVVDDDPSAREMIAAVLTLCGAHVTAMPSAAAAMEAIQQEWPDVLVSDIGMPAENGYEFIAQIRKLELEHGKKLPAVALTAFARTEDRLRALTAGFHTHVPKPADPTELALVIASISKAR